MPVCMRLVSFISTFISGAIRTLTHLSLHKNLVRQFVAVSKPSATSAIPGIESPNAGPAVYTPLGAKPSATSAIPGIESPNAGPAVYTPLGAKPSATSAIPGIESPNAGPAVYTPLGGYIFTKPVATQTSGTSGTLDSPAETSATSAIPSATSLAPEHTTVKTTTRGYIFTKPVATQTSGTSGALDSPAKPATSPGPAVNTPPGGPVPVLEHSLSQSVTVVIIFAVIAAIIGIIVGCASLISLLRRRYREQTSAPKTSEQVEEIEDSAP
ncbi:hypothetical protein R6Z07M_014904 [Ovis aries]